MAIKPSKMQKPEKPRKHAIRNVSLDVKRSAFSALFNMFSNDEMVGEVSKVRALLSNERARILHTIKISKPQSLYALAKLLGRDFKGVRKDLSILEHFGIVELVKFTPKNSKRAALRPVLKLDTLQINLSF